MVPQLAGIDASAVTKDNVDEFVADLLARYDEFYELEQIPPELVNRIDPLSELAERIHPDNIIVVQSEKQA